MDPCNFLCLPLQHKRVYDDDIPAGSVHCESNFSHVSDGSRNSVGKVALACRRSSTLSWAWHVHHPFTLRHFPTQCTYISSRSSWTPCSVHPRCIHDGGFDHFSFTSIRRHRYARFIFLSFFLSYSSKAADCKISFCKMKEWWRVMAFQWRGWYRVCPEERGRRERTI